ncbi:MAG TPA: ACP S-malonyltransferase [Candidatus Omnitrophota bacterium]|nr:ACP S-malonyltransferase [Candidatus Omnitrophota bacterium]HPT06574.1 ACP S-malonyltransferase [Candidatus Omnitrophota bacterium]
MVSYLFAGQGSQYIGMGKDLYQAFPAAREVFDRADEALGFSLSALCFEGPQPELTKTNNSQPAILTMSIACFESMRACAGNTFELPAYVAGLSLGEYSALVAAEAVSFTDAVKLVRLRGQFMEEEARKKPGTMLSIIGLNVSEVTRICQEVGAEVANFNCPGQTVISGQESALTKAGVIAKERGAKLAVMLEVSGAFHSSFMKGAADKLATELGKVTFRNPRFPVVSNVTAQPFMSAGEIQENLIKQVYSSVRWEESMRYILGKGVSHFIEFGSGKVLKGLMRRIDANVSVVNAEKKEDIEKIVSGV